MGAIATYTTTGSCALGIAALLAVGLLTISSGPFGEAARTLGDITVDATERILIYLQQVGIDGPMGESALKRQKTAEVETTELQAVFCTVGRYLLNSTTVSYAAALNRMEPRRSYALGTRN